MARALESYSHALAAGDWRGACAAFTSEGREQASRGGDFCEVLRRIASGMTPAERRQSKSTEAVRVEVDGDRATGYVRYGDCIVVTSGSVLVRDDAGDWRIDRTGGLFQNHEGKTCLE